MRTRNQRLIAIMLILTSMLLPTRGFALWGVGDIVHDPMNYINTLMTQANTLKSTINEGVLIANQAKSLEYQLVSLMNEAKNLQANPLRLLGQIEGLWNAYNGIMANAEGIGFNLVSSQQRFEAQYPALVTPSIQVITQRSADMLTSIRQASKVAVGTQSIYERLCEQLSNTKQAMTAAQASQGALQIAQAQAQIQALGNEQLAALTTIEAAHARVETEWIAMQAKEKEDGAAVNAAFMDGYGSQGFKQLGQGR